MKKLVTSVLLWLTTRIISKYNPTVIGITGSVGKTSTKEAVFLALNGSFKVRKTEKNFNNDIGLPLTVLGKDTANKSILGWLKILIHGFQLAFTNQSYPKVLVLEMGADKVGDIKKLASLAKPKYGILTALGASHLEHFKSMENIVKEKSELLKSLPKDGVAFLNADDAMVSTLTGKTKAKVLMYGFSDHADIMASNFNITEKNNLLGISFKVTVNGNTVPVFVPGTVSRHQASSVLAGIAVATSMGVGVLDVIQRFHKFEGPNGRLKPLEGYKDSIILDDTYNASPQSTVAALNVLSDVAKLKQSETWAVLGDMLELGNLTRSGHEEVGKKVAELDIDYLVTFGNLAEDISAGALASGMSSDKVFKFSKRSDASKYIQAKMSAGAIVLVKGSQGARMEKITKELLKDPLIAKTSLVRQTAEWN